MRIGWRAMTRFLAGETSPREAAEIGDWARRDPRYGELLENARHAWDATRFEEPKWDVDNAWRTVSTRLRDAAASTHEQSTLSQPLWRRPRVWLRAAMAAAVITAGMLLLRDGAGEELIAYTTDSEQLTVRLVDGSVVRLAPHSTLRVSPDGKREAWLDGTAFFGVAEQDGVPFIVHTRAGDARVLGTRFELRTEKDRVRLAVLEGKVELTAAGAQELVTAGQVSQTEKGTAPTDAKPADVQQLVGWLGEVLIFQDTPLAQAVQEIARHYGATVRVADASLGDRTISAVFDNQSLDDVMATVCRVADATCQMRGNSFVVLP